MCLYFAYTYSNTYSERRNGTSENEKVRQQEQQAAAEREQNARVKKPEQNQR